jgi:flagellar hook assembly protein FlgD
MDVSALPYVFYYVSATDFSGNEGKSAKVNTLSGVGGTPKHYVLSVTNYPNPFNPSTSVSYTVPERGAVTVEIYDTRGERVATLVSSAEHTAGAYTIEWTGRVDSGATASSGVYFARIAQNGSVRSKKMMLLK